MNVYYPPEVEQINDYFNESIQIIDEKFGEGYAKKNPIMVTRVLECILKVVDK
tara:strand:+ start:3081 stop:3239 length:159 start_codon:yes stop_codon:yes gene_type:complete